MHCTNWACIHSLLIVVNADENFVHSGTHTPENVADRQRRRAGHLET